MTAAEALDRSALRAVVLDCLHRIAPDTEVEKIPPAAPLREVLDLDSLDWTNVFAALEERLSVRIPAAEQGRLTTLDALLDALAQRAAAARAALPAPPTDTALPHTSYVLQRKTVTLRPMRADDRALEADFVQRLSQLSRYQRFMVTVGELPGAKLDELTNVDQQRHVALVATIEHEGAPRIVGVARYVVLPPASSCEFAVAIDDDWHGSGLAGLLLNALTGVARARGLRRMEGLVLRTNTHMLQFARQLGFTAEDHPEDRDAVCMVRAL